MELKQYYLGCLSHASYLIADGGEAIVVDPQRDVDAYLADAEALGVRIRHVALTHFHADFLAGHLELQRRTGATIHLGAQADADYPFEPAHDGDEIAVGGVRLRVLETPGHTPESISLVVLPPGSDTPHAVLTGDALFVGDVGRPDLLASKGVTAAELAGRLYDSLHRKLLTLPDATLVYPAHGAGSMCGKSLGTENVTTIGAQRSVNPALQPMSRDEFVTLVSADQPTAPAYFSYDADLNRRVRPMLSDTLEHGLRPLSLGELHRAQNAGAQILDTRSADAFAARHVAGTVGVPLDGRFATWAGAVLNPERTIVVVAEPGMETETITRLGRIGFDRVVGYLEDAPTALAAVAADDPMIATWERVDAADLAAWRARHTDGVVLDVRGAGEWQGGHVDGALHIPLAELPKRLDEVPADRPVLVYCRTGYRSVVGASVLLRTERTAVTDLRGGWEGLQALAPAEANA